MRVLFVTIGKLDNIEDHGIYTDLLRVFRDNGHQVYTVSARERRHNLPTEYTEEHGVYALRIKIGNITKCGLIEKGLSTVLIENQYLSAIKHYLNGIKFDLVIYSTPPITFAQIVRYIKKRDGAKSYLLLKDIFPQNAVDLGMFSGKSLIYRYFRHKEKQLYLLSDTIGCMSQANVDYIIKHNPYLNKHNVQIAPNSICPNLISATAQERVEIRKRFHIPQNRTVFIYGGNLGKPQDIPFIIKCIEENENNKDSFFVICGIGTEYKKLERYVKESRPNHLLLISGLARMEYNELAAACDVGLIFLDHRFTIPNFPSRLLSYMETGLPVLACTDVHSDIGRVIIEGGFGWWCESNDAERFGKLLQSIRKDEITLKGELALAYLLKYYTADRTYTEIMGSIKSVNNEDLLHSISL